MKLSSLSGKALMRPVRHKFAILWHTDIPNEVKLQILKTGAPRICTFMKHQLHNPCIVVYRMHTDPEGIVIKVEREDKTKSKAVWETLSLKK